MGARHHLVTVTCVVLACSAAAGLLGCTCSDSNVLAELTEFQGAVDRDFAAEMNQWNPTDIGATFTIGDGVRAGTESQAVLRLSEGSYVHLVAETQIRFQRTMPGTKNYGIDVETGEAEIVVGKSAFSLQTSVGLAVLEPGTRVRLRKVDDGVEFHVDIGQATFRTEAAGEETVRAGESVKIAIGAAVLARLEDDPNDHTDAGARANVDEEPEQPVERSPDSGPSEKQGPSLAFRQRASPEMAGPDYADLYVTAGEKFVVHTTKPPVAVEFRFGTMCPNDAVVRLMGKRRTGSRGKASANLLVPPGRSKYQVRCTDDAGGEGKVVAAGRVHVIRDSGRERLPRSAPSSFVDADGRRYKILYQNRLPNITFRWPKAPAGESFTLNIDPGSKNARNIKMARAQHTFSSGSLSEGMHQLRYQAAERASKTTTLQIRFDNAAPKASLQEPSEGGFSAGSEVTVSGVAVPGWNVSLIGGTMTMDESSRFKGAISYSGKYRAIALRITHPRRGVHYYLRRSGDHYE